MGKPEKDKPGTGSKKISRRTLLGGVIASAIVPVNSAFAKYLQVGVPLLPVFPCSG
jgi:sulfane dehydrogenase subunit SoxC